jgi:hypothetical protein
VAYWNLHERSFSNENGTWRINNEFDLHFFHYSGYSPFKPEVVSKYQDRIHFNERPDIVPLFEIYKKSLLGNHQEYWQTIPCFYIKPRKIYRFLRVRKIFKFPFEKVLRWIEKDNS